jgi:phage gpG-like protein
VTMPARPALGVNDADRVEIRALVADFVDMAAAT